MSLQSSNTNKITYFTYVTMLRLSKRFWRFIIKNVATAAKMGWYKKYTMHTLIVRLLQKQFEI